jgi:hypothetical protein
LLNAEVKAADWQGNELPPYYLTFYGMPVKAGFSRNWNQSRLLL